MTSTNQNPVKVSKRIVLLATTLTSFFFGYMFSAISIALPAIDREFHADAILLGWVSTAAILASGVLLIPFGKISDILGIKKIFAYGMVLYTVTAAVAPFSTSIEMLIVIRTVQGISAAMVVGNITALISVIFPPGERGRALGTTSAAVYTGVAVSPLLGGVLTEHFGWRSTFIVIVPAGIIITLLIILKIKGEWRGSKGQSLDYIGSTIFGIAVIALMYGLSILPDRTGFILIVSGILVFYGFLKWEERVKNPILNIDIFRDNRVFLFTNITAFINYAATFSVIFLLSLYLQYVKGLNAETAGLIMISQPVLQACLSPISGRLSDKFEPQIVSSIGMVICCIALVMFAFLSSDTSLVFIVFILAVMGIGLAVFVSPNNNAGMSSVEPHVYGVASAIIATMRQTGQLFSMGITMVILAVFMGRVVITPAYYPAFVNCCRIAFGLFAVLCFGGIFTSLARGKSLAGRR